VLIIAGPGSGKTYTLVERVIALIEAGKATAETLLVVTFVRRQGFWDQERPNLRESLAHLVGLIMRRAGGDASGVFRASFV
jgi:superfamily I DNA/RNA helicase